MPPKPHAPTKSTTPAAQAPQIAWPLDALRRLVEPDLPDFACDVLAVVDSTNSELMRRFKAGQITPTLLVAEQQTAGRGRLGKQWHSTPGASLTFSLGMMLSPAAWSGLSLAVGVALADSLDAPPDGDQSAGHAGALHIGLKWPNDLYLVGSTGAQQKLAGVLIETAVWEGMRYAVMGVGINIAPLDAAVGKAVASASAVPPGSLQQLLPSLDAAGALLQVVPALVRAVQAFAQSGFEPFQARFAARDVLAGRAIALTDGLQGHARGVTMEGALLVQTDAGVVVVASSEVSVRPALLPTTLPGSPTADAGQNAPC